LLRRGDKLARFVKKVSQSSLTVAYTRHIKRERHKKAAQQMAKMV